jgi:flagellar protein FlaG
MNIQPLASPTIPPLDERPAGAASATPAGPAAKAAPSRAEVDAAIKTLNDAMSVSSQTLEFSVDHDSKQIVVKLIDQNTREILRQIPSVEALEMAKSIDKLQGRLLHQTA